MGLTFTELYPEVNASFTMKVERVLFSNRSEFQEITVLETKDFGRVLLIDDIVMLTERDEFIYHEMITHVPLFVHPAPREVLIIGGGDGGSVRECLKHPDVKHVDLVDIDEMVSRACREHLPAVAGALISPKVTCRYLDGVAYVKNTAKCYDIIIIDSTDPIHVGEGLFSSEFYQHCFKRLAEDGILVNQCESPAWQADLVREISQKLRSAFEKVHYYQAHIPTYPSGHWLFGFASRQYHPLDDFRSDHYERYRISFRYYNKELHFGAFALPTFCYPLIDDA